jgi:hypothetical protein
MTPRRQSHSLTIDLFIPSKCQTDIVRRRWKWNCVCSGPAIENGNHIVFGKCQPRQNVSFVKTSATKDKDEIWQADLKGSGQGRTDVFDGGGRIGSQSEGFPEERAKVEDHRW